MIDWNFIASLEGSRVLHGYVPDPETSHSGVTIATGCDLGALSLSMLPLFPLELAATLKRYHGMTGKVAVEFLKSNPLTITEAQADNIDAVMRTGAVDALRNRFFVSSGKKFETLPDPVQTILASVTFQYGTPWVRTPHFWSHAIALDYLAMENDLENFGDHYVTRRRKEATYLREKLKGEQH